MNVELRANLDIGERGGKFIELGESAYVSDPSYELKDDAWYIGKIDNLLPGRYDIRYHMVESYGDRVHHLYVIHENYTNQSMFTWEDTDLDIGVDSGRCGFYNEDYWRYINSNKHLHDEFDDLSTRYNYPDIMSVDSMCVISRSGYGDGCYPFFVTKNEEGKVIGMMIQYMSDERND